MGPPSITYSELERDVCSKYQEQIQQKRGSDGSGVSPPNNAQIGQYCKPLLCLEARRGRPVLVQKAPMTTRRCHSRSRVERWNTEFADRPTLDSLLG